LGLQKSNQKEKEVDPFYELDSQGKKSKVGSALRSQYNFGEGRIKSSTRGKLVNVSEIQAFHMRKLRWYLALVNG